MIWREIRKGLYGEHRLRFPIASTFPPDLSHVAICSPLRAEFVFAGNSSVTDNFIPAPFYDHVISRVHGMAKVETGAGIIHRELGGR